MDGSISKGIQMPMGRSGHCMVRLHNNKVMILGANWPTGLK